MSGQLREIPFRFRSGEALDRLGAKPGHARNEGGSVNGAGGSQATWTGSSTGRAGGCERINRPYLIWIAIALSIADLTSCVTISRYQFAEPAGNWDVRSGQLLYRTGGTTLIGDVIIRFSKTGDFGLTFSKGPGVSLLSLRQNASFAEIKGPLARSGWSGPIDHAPQQLRGWLGLRDQLIRSQDRQSVQYSAGNETFLFRF
jgi:hypothetical protein